MSVEIRVCDVFDGLAALADDLVDCVVTSPPYWGLRNVWPIATAPFREAHFATFPPALVEPCIKAGCPKGGLVLDPFGGSGTVGLVADRLERNALLFELNPEYARIARERIAADAPLFTDLTVDA